MKLNVNYDSYIVKKGVMNRTFIYLLSTVLLIASSCNDVATTGYRGVGAGQDIVGDTSKLTCPTGVDCATSSDGTVGDGDGEVIIPKVEIRHLIEPKVDEDDEGGDYTRKLTLPKNYNGLLYLAGVNVTSLASKRVKVRFNFGQTREPITIGATVSQAAGLTPQTSVEVLVMDLRDRPFEDIQLIYDLYDYNDYTFKGSNDPSALEEPVQNNRNEKLFCRGLTLRDDPTYEGSLSSSCSSSDDICKYAYAKVVDKGLVKNGTPALPITPVEPNIQSGNESYFKDSDFISLGRCLPDNPSGNNYVYRDDTDNPPRISFSYGSSNVIDGDTYYFLGPYRPINEANWHISADAALGSPYGIFDASMSGSILGAGKQSYLFPLATKFDLPKGVEYLGSDDPYAFRDLREMVNNGESDWMDGCNLRATSVDNNTGEHIGSCNVTATIEIISFDDDGNEYTVDNTKDIKLQLVKAQELNISNENVLLSSFQSCTSSNQCSSGSCCFNGRCWSKSIVSQCVDDLNSYGNLTPGSSCNSDFQCASLCCNPGSGRCAVHDTLQDPEVLCSKPNNSFCIAKEWCAKQVIRECFIVRTGTSPTGDVTCALRCYTSEVYGDCVEGRCRAPFSPEPPIFNPNDPNVCATAIAPLDEGDLAQGAGTSNNEQPNVTE